MPDHVRITWATPDTSPTYACLGCYWESPDPTAFTNGYCQTCAEILGENLTRED
jgi:hypothetical protein